MKTQLSLVRIGVALAASLLALGLIGLTLTGSLWDEIAASGGFTHAKFDLLLGKREFHLSAYQSRGRSSIPSPWLRRAGYKYSVKHYVCVGDTSCYSYHETYDAQVRKAINRDFGYDIFSEYAAYQSAGVTIMVQHN
jgi:hypothetical protein